MYRKVLVKKLQLLSLILIIFLGFFTLGCTKKDGEKESKQTIASTLGLVVRNVTYNRKIIEGDSLDVRVLIENVGDADARNVRVYLDGLSTRWSPPTPLEKRLGNVLMGEKIFVDFSSNAPIIGENITYSFSIRLEYDYTSRYTAVFEILKENRNVKVSIKSESKSRAPISINISEYRYDPTSNRLKLRVILINNEIGKTTGDLLLFPEDMICDSTRVAIRQESKVSERPIVCELSLPQDFTSYYPQVKLTASYRYEYKSRENKVEVIRS